MPLPDMILNEPALFHGLEFYYAAFMDLTTCRAQGMGEGPISWTVIADYCNAFDIHGEQREDMFYFIRAMDSTYLEFRIQEIKDSTKN